VIKEQELGFPIYLQDNYLVSKPNIIPCLWRDIAVIASFELRISRCNLKDFMASILKGLFNIMAKIPVAFSLKKTIIFNIGFESFHMESRFW
jgi:hypothetical protein